MADYVRDLRANGTGISDELVCPLFLQELAKEYDVFRQAIGREKKLLTIDGLINELRARFDFSRKVKSRSSDTALVAPSSRRRKSGRAGAKRKKMGKEKISRSNDNGRPCYHIWKRGP